MRFEYGIIYVISSSLIGLILWFILSSFQITNAKEYSIFLVILLLAVLLVVLLHGKGILTSPSTTAQGRGDRRVFREGMQYKRKRYSSSTNTSSDRNSENQYNYTRKKFRNTKE